MFKTSCDVIEFSLYKACHTRGGKVSLSISIQICVTHFYTAFVYDKTINKYVFLYVKENVDTDEAKGFFEGNFSHVYFILYDCFVTAEANLRQRGKSKTTGK